MCNLLKVKMQIKWRSSLLLLSRRKGYVCWLLETDMIKYFMSSLGEKKTNDKSIILINKVSSWYFESYRGIFKVIKRSSELVILENNKSCSLVYLR